MTENDDSAADNFEDEYPELAAELNKYHAAALNDSVNLIVNVWHAGDTLHKIKAKLKHGQFGPWLAKNFEGSTSTARRYMRVRAKHARVRDLDPELSMRATLRMFSDGADEKSAEWQPWGTMQAFEFLRILRAVAPTADQDSSSPSRNVVHLEAEGAVIMAAACAGQVLGVAYADWGGGPFSVTLDLHRVHMLLASTNDAEKPKDAPWVVDIGVDTANEFHCVFSGGESHAVAVSAHSFDDDYQGRIQAATKSERDAVRYSKDQLARFLKGQPTNGLVLSRGANGETVVRAGENFIGLIKPGKVTDDELTLPDWIAS